MMIPSKPSKNKKNKLKNSDNSINNFDLELLTPKNEIKKYSYVEFYNHRIEWRKGYFVLDVKSDAVVLVEHFYTENNKGGKFSNIPFPFQVSISRVRLSGEKPPEILPKGWYKSISDYLDFWASRMIKAYGIRELQ